jgi:hypothetical protein
MARATAPVLDQPPDIIIGDLEGDAINGDDVFVFTDALDLRDVFVSDDTETVTDIKWSFFEASQGDISINGAAPLTPAEAAGAGPVNPPAPKSLGTVNGDAGETPPGEDGDALTLTIRDNTAVGGPPPPYGWDPANILANHTVTLYASDCSTFSERTFTVYTVDNTTDGFTGTLDTITVPPFTDWTLFSFAGLTNQGGGGRGGDPGFVGLTGLCLNAGGQTAGSGFAGWFWQSNQHFVQLVKNAYYVARLEMDRTGQLNNPVQPPPPAQAGQLDWDTIPLWDTVFSNVNAGVVGFFSHGQNSMILDNAGDANGIDRPQGLSTFFHYYAPSPTLAPQWTGDLTGAESGDNAYSPFAPVAATYGDMLFEFRMLDFDSTGINSQIDAGIICMETIEMFRGDLPTLLSGGGTVVYGSSATGLADSTHQLRYFDDPSGSRAGEEPVLPLNPDNSVPVQLTNTPQQSLNGGVAFVSAAFLEGDVIKGDPDFITAPNGGLVENAAKLDPVLHEDSTLYIMQVRLRNENPGRVTGDPGGPGTTYDPFDAMIMAIHSAANEHNHFSTITRASPLGLQIHDRAFSPRDPSQLAPTTYVNMFYGHNASLVDPNDFPNGNRFNANAQFVNTNQLGTENGFNPGNIGPSGLDPFSVESIWVVKVPTPSF